LVCIEITISPRSFANLELLS